MKAAASQNLPFTTSELDKVIKSLKNVAQERNSLDWIELQSLFSECGHLSHKNWEMTSKYADTLTKIIGTPEDETFRSIFERVLHDGSWESACSSASVRTEKPWVVLVTGLNGIRKTTSCYQSWFKEALHAALGESMAMSIQELPSAQDSFFRQLDYMIATVANEDFRELYEIKDVEEYSEQKDAIFARYRMLAEMVGVLLVKASIQKGINIMVETSGRDVAMFKYVDDFFPDDEYRKLAIRFTINDIEFAKRSVDLRMKREMRAGSLSLSNGASTREIIAVNAGGPYGSSVLAGVQADSDRVWEEVIESDDDKELQGGGEVGGGGLFSHWFKARLSIKASDTEDWTLCAVDKFGKTCAGPFPFAALEGK